VRVSTDQSATQYSCVGEEGCEEGRARRCVSDLTEGTQVEGPHGTALKADTGDLVAEGGAVLALAVDWAAHWVPRARTDVVLDVILGPAVAVPEVG
jgi:hypothetical protein